MSEQQPKPEVKQEQSKGQQNTGNEQQPNVTPYFFVEKLWDSALRIHWVKHENNLRAEKKGESQSILEASRPRASVADGSPELMPVDGDSRAAAPQILAQRSSDRKSRPCDILT